MSLKKLIFKNIVYSFVAKILNFAFILLFPIFLNDITLSDSNIFFNAVLLNVCTLFTIVFTNIIGTLLIKKILKDTEAGVSDISETISYLLLRVLLVVSVIFISLIIFKNSIVSLLHVKVYATEYLLYVLAFCFYVLNDFIRCVLQAHNRFNEFAVANIAQSIIQIAVFTAVFFIDKTLAVAASLLVSYVGLMFILLRLCSKFKISVKLNFTASPELSEHSVYKTAVPLILAHAVTVVTTFFFDYYATEFKGGVYTMYSLAFRIYSLPLLFIVTPLNEILLKRFTEISSSSASRLSDEVVNLIKLTLIILIPVVVAFHLLLNKPLAELILAYTNNKLLTLSNLLYLFNFIKLLSIYLIFNTLNQFSAKVFVSLSKFALPSLIGSIYFISCLVLVYFFRANIYYVLLDKVVPELIFLTPIYLFLVKKYLSSFDLKSIGLVFLKCVLCLVLADLFVFYNDNWVLTKAQEVFFPIMILTLVLIIFAYLFKNDLKFYKGLLIKS